MVDELAPNFDADDFVVAGDVVDVAEELVSHLCQIGTVVARVLRCGTDHGHAVDEALELVELLEHRQLVGVEERTSTVTREYCLWSRRIFHRVVGRRRQRR